MDLGLDGRAALVTGGSRGLGRASALELVREGASVMLAARDAAALASAAEEIALEVERGGPATRLDPVTADDADIWLGADRGRPAPRDRVAWTAGDLAEAATPERLVQATVERFRRLDILVVNAGGPPPGPFESITEEQWSGSIEVTFRSAVRLVRAALPHLRAPVTRAAGGGRIVFIEGGAVKQPVANLVTSNSVRSAVQGLMKTLSIELAADGIRVNAVAPGRLNTRRTQELDEDAARSSGRSVADVRGEHERAIPLGRYGDPAELGAVVAFLASTRAGYVTGTLVPVDGGQIRTML